MQPSRVKVYATAQISHFPDRGGGAVRCHSDQFYGLFDSDDANGSSQFCIKIETRILATANRSSRISILVAENFGHDKGRAAWSTDRGRGQHCIFFLHAV